MGQFDADCRNRDYLEPVLVRVFFPTIFVKVFVQVLVELLVLFRHCRDADFDYPIKRLGAVK